MMKFRKITSIILVVCTILLSAMPAMAAEGDVVILYTNDIHSNIDRDADPDGEPGLSYSKVAALKDELGALLVDAGDHIQGTAFGSMDNGASVIRLMNLAGYDVATLGNHEFDYGMDVCMAAVEAAGHTYVSSNFRHLTEGEPGELVLDAYTMVEHGGKKIAFVGITTPEPVIKSMPEYFMDEHGNFVYGIDSGEDGSILYESVQAAIDSAVSGGADYIIALGHLGEEKAAMPWTSREVIANTTGLDAFIDGHSHTTIEYEEVMDKSGETVVLTQTGSYFDAVGQLIIRNDGTVHTKLLSGEDLKELKPDPEVKAAEEEWIARVTEELGDVIGFCEVTLDNYDQDGNRLVRRQSTNSGDFAADALRHLFADMDMKVDAAIVNGGGVRNQALSGELTYIDCKAMHAFGNVACLLEVSGQQILDALEWGASSLTEDNESESGGFLQVSGIKYSVDLSIPSTVQSDENRIWTGSPTGEYRVKDVLIQDCETGEYMALELDKHYRLAGYNYILRNGGDGFAMFDGAVNILDYVAEDYMVAAQYIQSFPEGENGVPTITADSGYGEVTGSGRITVLGIEPAAESTGETDAEQEKSRENTYEVEKGDCLWRIAERFYGDGAMWTHIYEANAELIDNPDLIFIGQQLAIPAL